MSDETTYQPDFSTDPGEKEKTGTSKVGSYEKKTSTKHGGEQPAPLFSHKGKKKAIGPLPMESLPMHQSKHREKTSLSSSEKKLQEVDAGSLGQKDEIQKTEEKIRKMEIEEDELEKEILKKIKEPAKTGGKIGPQGGALELYDCSMTIPPGALENEVEFQMLIDTDPDHFPEDRVCISPILICKPSMSFKKPVTLQLSTYSASQGEKVKILQKKGTRDWEKLKKLRLSDKGSVKFKVTHFCRFTVALQSGFSFIGDLWAKLSSPFRSNPHRLGNDLYINKDTAVMASAFYLYPKTHNDVNSVMESMGFVRILGGLPIEYDCLYGDILKLEIKCKKPENTTVKSYNGRTTLEFSNQIQKVCPVFQLDPDLPDDYVGFLLMDYYIINVTNREQPVSENFLVKKKWPIGRVASGDNRENAVAGPSISAETVYYQSSDIHTQAHGTTSSATTMIAQCTAPQIGSEDRNWDMISVPHIGKRLE